MTTRTGYYFAWAATIGSFLLIAAGLKRILEAQGPGGVRGIGSLFGGASIGVIAASLIRYYRQRRNEAKDQQQIAIETLATLGKSTRIKK